MKPVVALLAVALATLPGLVQQQTVQSGPCPVPQLQEGFNLSRFLGRWYEIERSFVLAELGWRCITTEYKDEADGYKVETLGRTLLLRRLRASVEVDPSNPARLTLRGEGSLPTESTNMILSTDYDEYAIVWSCHRSVLGFGVFQNLTHSENLWILSRKNTLDPELKQKAYDIIDEKNIIRRGLRPVNQENCE